MSKERNYIPYINKSGVLENVPKEQMSIDGLMAEIQEEESLTESAGNRTHQAIGAAALAEKQSEPTTERVEEALKT